jgi:hypothetical protein
LTGILIDVANESIDFFFDYARLAVAVFLCVGGFLAGLKLSEPNFFVKHSVQQVIWQKYLRLVIPYLGAIALAIASGAHPKTIQQWAGHSNFGVTMDRYGHLFPGHDDGLAEGLDAMRS